MSTLALSLLQTKLTFGVLIITLVGTPISFALGHLLIPHEILIESRESKTESGLPVFNRISHWTTPGKEIWMMQQSHLMSRSFTS